MIPLGRIAHALPGRKRIRIEGKRGNHPYFERLEKELAECPGVLKVGANPVTGTVLVNHTAGDSRFWHHASERGLFQLAEGDPPIVARGMRASDKTLPKTTRSPASSITAPDMKTATRNSSGSVAGSNMRRLLFLGMMSVGVVQTMQGNIAIPALTAFWYALSALHGIDDLNPEYSLSQDEA